MGVGAGRTVGSSGRERRLVMSRGFGVDLENERMWIVGCGEFCGDGLFVSGFWKGGVGLGCTGW